MLKRSHDESMGLEESRVWRSDVKVTGILVGTMLLDAICRSRTLWHEVVRVGKCKRDCGWPLDVNVHY